MFDSSIFIDLWVKPQQPRGGTMTVAILGSQPKSLLPFTIGIRESNQKPRLFVQYAGMQAVGTRNVLTYDEWHHIYFGVQVKERNALNDVVDSASVMAIVNGTLELEDTVVFGGKLPPPDWIKESILVGEGDAEGKFVGSIGTISFWQGKPTIDKAKLIMENKWKNQSSDALSEKNLIARFQVADNGYGQPQYLVSGAAKAPVPEFSCASKVCLDMPYYYPAAEPTPTPVPVSPSPSPAPAQDPNLPEPVAHHRPAPSPSPYVPRPNVVVNASTNAFDVHFADIHLYIQKTGTAPQIQNPDTEKESL